MIDKSIRIRVEDMLAAIAVAKKAARGLVFESYSSADHIVERFAIERSIEIVSEASRKLPEHIQADYPEIPWHAIRGIGNVLRHEYAATDHRIIWDVTVVHLEQLEAVLVRILASLPPEIDN